MEGSALKERATEAHDEVTEGRVEFHVDVPFVRNVLDEESAKRVAEKAVEGRGAEKAKSGDLILSGYASTWVLDRDYEYISRRAFDTSLEAYLSKNPILLWQHDHRMPMGQVASGETDETGLLVEAYVRKPKAGEAEWKISAYEDVKAGIVRTFSIGGFFDREIVDGEILITNVDLFEISCVSVPSNPDSIYEAAVKAVKGQPMAAGGLKLVQQMYQLLGLAELADPELVQMDDRQKLGRYYELAGQFALATGKSAPGMDFLDGIEDPVEQTIKRSDAMILLAEARHQLEPDEKAGRVLSKKNESALQRAVDSMRKAADEIEGVLEQVREEQEEADENATTGEQKSSEEPEAGAEGAEEDDE